MSTEEQPQLQSQLLPKLHVVGDSISMHYGPYLEVYLAGILHYSRKPPENADPDSANGRDSNDVLAYLRSLPDAYLAQFRYLMVNCGLHDVKRSLETGDRQVETAQYAANLHALVELATRAGARLVWVRTTPIDDEIHNSRVTAAFRRYSADLTAYNAIADAVMSEAGVPVIDLYGFTRGFGREAWCDHVHFRDEVRRGQAAFIAGALGQILRTI